MMTWADNHSLGRSYPLAWRVFSKGRFLGWLLIFFLILLNFSTFKMLHFCPLVSIIPDGKSMVICITFVTLFFLFYSLFSFFSLTTFQIFCLFYSLSLKNLIKMWKVFIHSIWDVFSFSDVWVYTFHQNETFRHRVSFFSLPLSETPIAAVLDPLTWSTWSLRNSSVFSASFLSVPQIFFHF